MLDEGPPALPVPVMTTFAAHRKLPFSADCDIVVPLLETFLVFSDQSAELRFRHPFVRYVCKIMVVIATHRLSVSAADARA